MSQLHPHGPHAQHNKLAPIPGAQAMTPADLGQPSPEPPPVPDGFTLPAYAASMPNARGLIRLAANEPAFAAGKTNARYFGLQDVLVDFAAYLSPEAVFSLTANFGNARMKLGPMIAGTGVGGLLGKTFRTYPFDAAPEGSGKAFVQNGEAYNDALTFCADAQTPGTRAEHLEAWAAYNDAHNVWPQVV